MSTALKQNFNNLSETDFINLIDSNQGILQKVINLYTDLQEDRQDLQQEILIQWWKALKNFNQESLISTFLYKVALNVALNYKRKKKVSHVDLEMAKSKLSVNQGETYEILYLIIKALPPIEKMLVTLHLDGYKNAEIAEIAEISANNLAVKLHRIKAQISKKLKANQDEY